MKGKGCIIGKAPVQKTHLAVFFAFVLALFGLCLLLPGGNQFPGSSALLQKAAEGLTSYDLILRLDDHEDTLAISQTVDFRNDTGDALSTLVLRTWLNAYQEEESSPAALEEIYEACYPEGFSPGFLSLYDVKWNGEAAQYRYLDEGETALEIAIPPLLPGERGILEIRSVGKIPLCSHRLGKTDAGYQLGNIIPLLSRYEKGAWRTEEYAPVGDPFVSDCANFSLTLHLPEGYLPACSAPLKKQTDGSWQGEILSARDLGLCVSKGYQLAKGKAGDTFVYAYGETKAGAKRALQCAKKAIQIFSSLYGDYPWPSYTVCSVDFPFGGMEYPAFCMISGEYEQESMEDSLDLLIAHETAHQWFYAMVGSDQYYHPWQDEALSEYAALRYVQKRYGQGSYETLKYFRVDAPMQENIPGSLTPGSPMDYFGSLNDYTAVVYGRGAALLIALEEMLPKGADDFLRAYAEKYAFRYVPREEFEAFLNAYAGMDLSPLLIDYLDTAH